MSMCWSVVLWHILWHIGTNNDWSGDDTITAAHSACLQVLHTCALPALVHSPPLTSLTATVVHQIQWSFSRISKLEGHWYRLDLLVIFILFFKTPLWFAHEQLMVTLVPQEPEVVNFWTMYRIRVFEIDGYCWVASVISYYMIIDQIIHLCSSECLKTVPTLHIRWSSPQPTLIITDGGDTTEAQLQTTIINQLLTYFIRLHFFTRVAVNTSYQGRIQSSHYQRNTIISTQLMEYIFNLLPTAIINLAKSILRSAVKTELMKSQAKLGQESNKVYNCVSVWTLPQPIRDEEARFWTNQRAAELGSEWALDWAPGACPTLAALHEQYLAPTILRRSWLEFWRWLMSVKGWMIGWNVFWCVETMARKPPPTAFEVFTRCVRVPMHGKREPSVTINNKLRQSPAWSCREWEEWGKSEWHKTIVKYILIYKTIN